MSLAATKLRVVPKTREGSKYPTQTGPKDKHSSLLEYTAILLGIYAVRIACDHLSRLDQNETGNPGELSRIQRFCGMRPEDLRKSQSKCGCSDTDFEDYIEKNGLSPIIYHINGLQSKSMYNVMMDPDIKDKPGGLYRVCINALNPPKTGGAVKKVEAALKKTICYSWRAAELPSAPLKEFIVFYWDHILDLLSEEKSKKENEKKLKEDSYLDNYNGPVAIAEEILGSKKDPFKITVIEPSGNSTERQLLEYCESSVGDLRSWDEVKNAICMVANVLSRMSYSESYFRIEYDESDQYVAVSPTAEYSEENEKRDHSESTLRTVPDTLSQEKKSGSAKMASIRRFTEIQCERLVARSKRNGNFLGDFADSEDNFVDFHTSDGRSYQDIVYDSLMQRRSVLLSGGAGMGKSRLARMVYMRLYQMQDDPEGLVPIIVHPRIFDNPYINSDNLIQAIVSEELGGAYGGLDIDRSRVVLFIDALDETFSPESRGIDVMLDSTSPFTCLVSGRTEMCRTIEQYYPDSILNLGLSIDNEMFLTILKRFLSPDKRPIADRFADGLDGIPTLPLTAVLLSHYLERHDVAHGEQRLIADIFDDMIDFAIRDKIETYNRENKTALTVEKARIILYEYAWDLYRRPRAAMEDRISDVHDCIGYKKKTIRWIVNEFTVESENDRTDREFAHRTIRDFLVARWIVRQSTVSNFDKRLLDVVFCSDVRRFLGDLMESDVCKVQQFTYFCKGLYRQCATISDTDLRGNYQAKVLHLLLVSASIDNENAKYELKGLVNRVIRCGDVSPQYVVCLVCGTMLGDFSVESEYYRMLVTDARTAEISRRLYMMYEGDIDPLDLPLEDSPCRFENTLNRFLLDLTSDSVSSRSKYMARVHTVMIQGLLEHGYLASEKRLTKLARLNVRKAVDTILSDDVRDNLRRFGFSDEKYRSDLSEELEKLVRMLETTNHRK